MAHDVFISYSSQDKIVADAVCAALEHRRIRCWIAPRDILPGVPYGESLAEALEASRILLLLLSKGANASTHVMREVEAAVGRGIAILPLRIEDVLPSKSLGYYLKAIHWLDALTPPFEKHLQTLADSVQRLLDRQAGSQGTPPPGPEPGSGGPGQTATGIDGDAEADRAVTLFVQGDYAGAAAAFERAIAADVRRHVPEELCTTLGNAYQNLDRADEAVAAHRKAVQINPRYHQAWANMGIAYRMKGDTVEAERCYLKAIELKPDYAEVHSSLGVLQILKGEPSQAIASLEKAIQLDRQLASAHANLAAAYAAVGRFDDAESSLRKSIALGYKNSAAIRERIDTIRTQGPDAYVTVPTQGAADAEALRGVQAFNANDYAQAAEALQRAIDLGSVTQYPPEELWTMLGNTLYRLDRVDQAIAAHRRAVEINPRSHNAWVNLGVAYRIQGKFDDAETCYQTALDIQPEYAELHSSLGVLYIFKDEPQKAVASLERSIQLDPTLPVPHGNLAMAYAMCDRFDDAESTLTRATEMGYKDHHVIRERIDALAANSSARRKR